MSCTINTGCCPEEEIVDCGEETCLQRLCRLEAYIEELFSRTDYLNQLNKGAVPLKVVFLADAGQVSDEQTTLGLRVAEEAPSIILAGGDNNYETGSHTTIEVNWAYLSQYINQGVVFPALGNHDLDDDVSNPGVNQYNKFPYLPGNRRYYVHSLPDQSADIFVLNSGRNTAGEIVEPDGIAVNSDQYKWFVNALGESCARFKIVMFHHPFVSGTSNAVALGRVYPEMDWLFDILGVDLILNGHTHTAQHLNLGGVDILDVSSPVRGRRQMSASGTIYGSRAASTALKWAYAGNGAIGDRAYATLEFVGTSMIVSVKRLGDGVPIYAFPIIK